MCLLSAHKRLAVMSPLLIYADGCPAQVLELYTQQLQQRDVVTQQEVSKWRQEAGERFEAELAASRAGDYNVSAAQWLGSTWQGDALQVRPCCIFWECTVACYAEGWWCSS